MTQKFSVFELLTPKESTYYIPDNSTIRQAVEKFKSHKFSVVPIIDKEGNYITSVSEGDILRFITNNSNNYLEVAETIKVIDIEKNRPYVSLNADAVFDEVYALCLSQNFVPIVDDRNKLIGIIKRKDVFVYLRNNFKDM